MSEQKKQRRGQADRLAVICTALRRAIIERALLPGDRLPEDTLGERFGASRTIARAALLQLSAEGLVELRRNRIAVVAAPSFQDARDIFDIRIALDVRWFASRRHADGCAGAGTEAIGRGGARCPPRPGRDAIRLATEFHVRLAEMTGKPILIRYVTEICYRAGCLCPPLPAHILPNVLSANT